MYIKDATIRLQRLGPQSVASEEPKELCCASEKACDILTSILRRLCQLHQRFTQWHPKLSRPVLQVS